jgi:ribosomal 50S subunit-associated protein YjgA (DUF615 family)
VLTYGAGCAAKAEFFDTDDLSIIRREHREFTSIYDEVYAEREPRARKRIKDNGEELDEEGIKKKIRAAVMNDARIEGNGKKASYEQYELMKKSGLDIDKICAQKEMVIRGGDIFEIKEKLGEYVGAKGRYMPFTKSVELTLDFPELENIRVVDTPGVNDPIKSRETRTEEYLRECDVVFIVSPAGQFVNAQDMELMDRLSSREGVRELFLVASQADTGVMMQSIVEEAGGDLRRALSALREQLSEHAGSALGGLKSQYPEISDLFDQIIYGGAARVITTSGLCHSMATRYDRRDEWSEAMLANLAHLAEHYPDNFDESSGKYNLELLGNTKPVREAIDEVRKRKDEIIRQKSADYIKQQQRNTDDYLAEIIITVSENISRLKNSDLQQIAENKRRLDELIAAGTDAINEKINERLDASKKRLRELLETYSNAIEASANKNIDRTKEMTSQKVKKKGLFSFFVRLFNEELGYKTESVLTLRAGAAKNQINNDVTQFTDDIAEEIKAELKEAEKNLNEQIFKTFRVIADKDNIDYSVVNRAVKSMVQAFLDGIEWSFSPPTFSYGATGTISGQAVTAFEDASKEYMQKLKKNCDDERRALFKRLDENKAANDPAKWIFADTEKQLDNLKKELMAKETTMERLNSISERLTALKET